MIITIIPIIIATIRITTTIIVATIIMKIFV